MSPWAEKTSDHHPIDCMRSLFLHGHRSDGDEELLLYGLKVGVVGCTTPRLLKDSEYLGFVNPLPAAWFRSSSGP